MEKNQEHKRRVNSYTKYEQFEQETTSGSKGVNVPGGKQGRDIVCRITKLKLDRKETSGEEFIISCFTTKRKRGKKDQIRVVSS